jgi:hypothetical protein
VTTSLAIYAAVIATAGLVWRIYSWRRSHSTRIRVELTNGFLTGLPAVPHVALVTLKNQSAHSVRVTSGGFRLQDGSGRTAVVMPPPPGATLPGTVESRDAGTTWLDVDELERIQIDVYRPLVAWVTLATGETFRSKPKTLMKRSSARDRQAA